MDAALRAIDALLRPEDTLFRPVDVAGSGRPLPVALDVALDRALLLLRPVDAAAKIVGLACDLPRRGPGSGRRLARLRPRAVYVTV